MIPCSDQFLNTLKNSPIKEMYIKLEFYNSQMQYIKEYTQQVSENDIGSISIDITRPIRRSFSFALNNISGEFNFGEDRTIWIDKRIKLFLGLKLPNKTIEYIPQGVFVLSNPSNSHTLNDKKCYIDAVDKAFLLTDKRGKFVNQLTIEKNTNIATAIKLIAQGAGETLFNFDIITETTPYELTYQAEDNRWKAIDELAKLGKCDIFYDINGYLRLKKIDLNEFEQYPSVWVFKYSDLNEKFYAGNVRKFDDSNLSNHIIAYGGSSETATVRYELKVDENDPMWVNNPYSIQKIGDLLYAHNNSNPDALLQTVDDCKFRCKFELRNRLGFTERLELYSSPVFLFEGGDIIEIEDLENGIEISKYLIQSMYIPIKPELMTIECFKYKRLISDWNFI